MQKKAMRRIFKAHYNEHTNNYFMELNALKLFDLLKYKTGLSNHKANKNLLPKNVQDLLVHMYGHVHTRQTGNFQEFNVRTTKKQMCISMDGPKLWNSLETILKEETSKHMHKHKFKQIIMESYINNCIDLLLMCGTKLMLEIS